MEIPLRVLILEDQAEDAELMMHELRRAGFEPAWQRVDTEQDYIARIAETPDLILADYSLPQFDALRGLQLLLDRGLDVPFIIVSGSVSEEAAVECMKVGASDYLLKDRLARLGQAVTRALEQKHLRDSQRQAAEEKERLLKTLGKRVQELTALHGTARILQNEDLSTAKLLQEIVCILPAGWKFPEITAARLRYGDTDCRTANYADTPWMQCAGFTTDDGKTGEIDISYLEERPEEAEGPFLAEERYLIKSLADMLRVHFERKRVEGEFRRVNRALRAVSECHSVLIHATQESDLAQDVCRIIVEMGGYHLAWVGLGVEDPEKTVTPVGQWGYEAGYLDTMRLSWAASDRGRGPTGVAIRTGKAAVVRDILGDPSYAPWRAEAARRGYASTAALPLSSEGRPFGVLNIYAVEADAFGTEELRLLVELADDLAFGIVALRTRAERERGQERLRLQSTALEAAANAIVITDREGHITWVNPAFSRLTGYTDSEVLGKNPRLLKSGVHDPAFYRNLWETILSGRIWRGQVVNRRKDGSLYIEEQTITPVPDPSGAIQHFIGIKQDITESERAQEALRQSEQRLALHVQQTPLAVIEWDTDFRVVKWNPGAERVFGFTGAEAVGRYAADLIIPLTATERVWQVWKDLLHRKGGERSTNENTTKDGQTILCEWYNTPLVTASGTVIGVASLVLDVTERKRAEEALMTRTRQLETIRAVTFEITRELDLNVLLGLIHRHAATLVGATAGVIWLWDDQAEWLNPRAWHGLGDWIGTLRYRLGEGVAGTVAQRREGLLVNDYQTSPFIQPSFLERTQIRAVLAEPLVYREQLRGVLVLGSEDPREAFTEEDRQLLGLFAAQAAIAIENSRLYEAVRQQAVVLEERVRDRTQELAAANRQLKAASRHKSEFLANMSHELRTPLNSILGFAQILQEQCKALLEAKQTRYLTNIYTSGQHLLQLINDILDLSKIEAGKIVLQPEPLPVDALLEDILIIARGLANKKAQTITTTIAPDLPPLHADPVRFKQILFNLLSNAVKFTPQSGTITVTARRVPAVADCGLGDADWGTGSEAGHSAIRTPQSEMSDFLEIAVTDTGIGINAEDLPRLFQEFVQLESTRAQQHEGTGLGLALSRRLVELHGGRIWAASPGEGQGSTFTLRLPMGGPRQ